MYIYIYVLKHNNNNNNLREHGFTNTRKSVFYIKLILY